MSLVILMPSPGLRSALLAPTLENKPDSLKVEIIWSFSNRFSLSTPSKELKVVTRMTSNEVCWLTEIGLMFLITLVGRAQPRIVNRTRPVTACWKMIFIRAEIDSVDGLYQEIGSGWQDM